MRILASEMLSHVGHAELEISPPVAFFVLYLPLSVCEGFAFALMSIMRRM